jgi:cell wall-associated NlpC family hydrolase
LVTQDSRFLSKGLIGTPFISNGRDPNVGLDCWGVFKIVMGRFGITNIPDFDVNADDSRGVGRIFFAERSNWIKIDKPEAGCAVALSIDPMMMGIAHHFGVCLDDKTFIHTMRKAGCIITRLDDRFFGKKIKGFYRWSG